MWCTNIWFPNLGWEKWILAVNALVIIDNSYIKGVLIDNFCQVKCSLSLICQKTTEQFSLHKWIGWCILWGIMANLVIMESQLQSCSIRGSWSGWKTLEALSVLLNDYWIDKLKPLWRPFTQSGFCFCHGLDVLEAVLMSW